MNLESQRSNFNSLAHCFSNYNDLMNHSGLLWTCRLWFRRSEWSPGHSLWNRAPGSAKAAGPQNSKTWSGKALVCLSVPEWFFFPHHTVNLNGRLFPFHSILHLLWDVVPANKESSVVEAARKAVGCKGRYVVSRAGRWEPAEGPCSWKRSQESLLGGRSCHTAQISPDSYMPAPIRKDHTQESRDFYDISPPVSWTLLLVPCLLDKIIHTWTSLCFCGHGLELPSCLCINIRGPGLPLSDPGSVLTPWLKWEVQAVPDMRRKMCVISTTFSAFPFFIIILAKSLQTLSFPNRDWFSLFMDANSWGRFPLSAHFLLCHSSFFAPVFPQGSQHGGFV